MTGNEPIEGELLTREFMDGVVEMAALPLDGNGRISTLEKIGAAKSEINGLAAQSGIRAKASLFKAIREFLNLRGYQFLSVGDPSDDEFYFAEPKAPRFYKRMTKEKACNLCANVYIDAGVALLEKDVTACADTMLRFVKTKQHVDEVDKRYVAMIRGLVFDKNNGVIVREEELPENAHIFFSMFDTPVPSIKIPEITGFTLSDIDTTIQYYNSTYNSLVESGDIPNEEFGFISAWADYDHSTYMDIMKAFASPLLKTLPRVCIFLIGTGTNGKSACVNLMHTVYGEANTTRIKIAETGDWHKALSLKYTLVNCPDEDSLNFDAAKKVRDPITDFKTFAAHEKIEINKMREQTPITIKCDFMSIIPMNHMVDWTTEEDAGPLIKRSLVINFDNDLETDKRVDMREDFAVATYTHEVMARFVGTIAGIAGYYTRNSKPMEFSEKAKRIQAGLKEEQDSAATYRVEFEKHFCAYESIKILYEDYVKWCEAKDLTPLPRGALDLVFKDYKAGGRQKVPLYCNPEKKAHAFRSPKKRGLKVMAREEYSPKNIDGNPMMSIEEMHENNLSAVEQAQAILEGGDE